MPGELAPPDFSRAFVKVPRAVLRELLADPLLLAVYMAVLDRAAYHAGPRLLRGHGVQQLGVGEAVVGRSELAEACGSTSQSIRTALAHLRKLGFLTSKPTNLGTRITVVGYGGIPDIADADQPADQPMTNQPSTSDQPADQPLTDKRRSRNAKTKETKRPSGVHRLRDFWASQYQSKHGDAYIFGGGYDFKLLKDLEANPGIEETERRMAIAFTAPPDFPKQPWSLRTFVNNINSCAKPNEGRTNNDVRVGQAQPKDPSEYGSGEQEI